MSIYLHSMSELSVQEKRHTFQPLNIFSDIFECHNQAIQELVKYP